MFGINRGLNLRNARQRYWGHTAWFGNDEKYARAIKIKRANSVPLDDPEAAFAFWFDHPELF